MESQLSLRVNSIGITYKIGKRQNWHYQHIIEDIFGVSEELVAGIDDRGETRWLLEVSTKECYEYICNNFCGREIVINSNCYVQIDDISYPGTRVELSNVPFSITNQQLTVMMQKFGIIHKCQSYFRIFGKYSNLKKSGDRVMWISIHGHIPKTLNISKTDMTVDVYYFRQPFSCDVCGKIGHWERNCRCKSDDHINIIELKDTHTGVIEVDNDKTELQPKPLNAITKIADVNIEPSQNGNEYKCTMCEYKCGYINIFKDHLLTHTGESTIVDHTGDNHMESDIFDFINEARVANSVITHVCSICKSNFKSKSELCKHLRVHSIFACEKCDYTNNSLHGLNGHIKIHSEKKYDCTICAFKGNSVNNLNNHMKTHLGDEICTASQRNKRDYSINPEINKNPRQNKVRKL